MNQNRNFLIVFGLTVILSITAAFGIQAQQKSVQRKATGKTASAAKKATPAKTRGTWIYFNGGEDIKALAADSKNIYSVMNFSNRMVAIDKSTGEMKEIKADNELGGVTVANDKCYFTVRDEGIFSYDPATNEVSGPLFDTDITKGAGMITSSPNGRYLYGGGVIVDLNTGQKYSAPKSDSDIYINDIGGSFICQPEVIYTPLGGEPYKINGYEVTDWIYPDPVTDNIYYCYQIGLGYTPMVPTPEGGITKINPEYEKLAEINRAKCITRDDNGNFVLTTNYSGVGFGGKNIDDPLVMEQKIDIDVKNEYGWPIYLESPTLVRTDGNGNLVFASPYSNYICIYNKDGLNGYSAIKGKAVKF